MAKKNDLSAFKDTPTPREPILSEPKKGGTGSRGRKKKPESEKASEIVSLKFTKAEKALLLEKSGLIPLGTFLKNELKTKTDIFG